MPSDSFSYSYNSTLPVERDYIRKLSDSTGLFENYLIRGKEQSATSSSYIEYNHNYITDAATSNLGSEWKNIGTLSGMESRIYGVDSGTAYSGMNINTGTSCGGTITWSPGSEITWKPAKVDPAERLRAIIKSRQAPRVIVPNRKLIPAECDIREHRARETLCRVIGPDAFRRFRSKGFVTLRGKSGKTYQLFPGSSGHTSTKVWENGKPVQDLCIVLRGKFPPTDNLIMRALLVLNDERELWKMANKMGSFTDDAAFVTITVNSEMRSLPEVFAELKARAA